MSSLRYFRDDPFFSFPGDEFFGGLHQDAILDRPDRRHGDQRRQENRVSRRNEAQDVFDMRGFLDPFQGMSTMMNNMNRMFGDLSRHMEEGTVNGKDGQMFSATNFVSYSNADGGEPKIYQATSAVRQGPGGLRETRKTERSSVTGMDKMAVGRHINERGHVIMKQRDRRTGHMDEHQDYLNINEDEAENFDNEWQDKARQYFGHVGGSSQGQRGHVGYHGDRDFFEDDHYPSSHYPTDRHRQRALEYNVPEEDDHSHRREKKRGGGKRRQ